jgi:hypothetical protein
MVGCNDYVFIYLDANINLPPVVFEQAQQLVTALLTAQHFSGLPP